MYKAARILLPSLLLAAMFVALFQAEPFSDADAPSDSFVFEVQIEAPADAGAFLFYDRGEGFRALDAFSTKVRGGAPSTCRFLVPPGAHRGFRIEIAQPAGVVRIRGTRLADLHGNELARFSAAQFRGEAPQDLVEQRDGSAVVRSGGRAGAVLRFPEPLVLRPPCDFVQAATQFALVALAAALALWKLGPFAAARRERIAAVCSSFLGGMRARPVRTLFASAALAAVVSCHPIVFLGKSFVAPDNGAPCLYEGFPTLPGAADEKVENAKGSDIGAMLWAHLPYSMIEHRAIFRDGELPFRIRENSAGVPLLGQGQSMLGDPLHWIPICANGAAWAWDVNFVLAKILFAFGIGLLVRAAVDRLGVAVLLAASSAFIGFFSYRFAHVAFFSLCYAPWILLAWVKVLRAAAWRDAVPWAVLLIAANFVELNSGTAKESAMLIAGLNAAGLLALALARESLAQRARRLAVAASALVIFVLVSAPCWLVFLDALKQAWTFYDMPHAYQIRPSLFIGLFDDLFYRQTMPQEIHANPSANFLVLIGFLWALVAVRQLSANRIFLSLAIATLPLFAIVFGVIPPAWIVRLPFIGNIFHIDNTFSCMLLVLLFPLAGFGLQRCWDSMRTDRWTGDWVMTMVCLGVLAALFFGYIQVETRAPNALIRETGTVTKSPFFMAYAAALLASVALLPWVVRGLFHRRSWIVANALLAVLCLFVLHFRHGMYAATKFDGYVMNPKTRPDFQTQSPAVGYVKAHLPEPARVAGFGDVLSPGFNAVLGLESPGGADAVGNRRYREFIEATNLPIIWDWRLSIRKDSAPVLLPFYDLLNLRYYLGTPAGPPSPVAGLKLIGTRDLDVYESPTVWPRAFFTDALATYGTIGDFVRLVWEGDRRPLAAAQSGDMPANALNISLPERQVVPAADYRLTSNTTAFTVDAPSAGVAVLTEAYEAGNFRVTLDGAPASYFRVNHAFLGVPIPHAGKFTVRFEYWPRRLTLALWMSAAGLVLLTAGLAWVRLSRPVTT